MKRSNYLTAILIVVLSASPLLAQLELGVQGGINITTLRGNDENGDKIDFKSRNGLALGGIVGLLFGDALCLYFQPMLLQKGAEFSAEDLIPGLPGEPVIELGYLEIPIMLRFDLGSAAIKPYLMAGGSVGIHLGSDLGGQILDIPLDVDLTEIVETFDFSADGGLGLRLDFSAFSLFAEGHYQYGFTDVLKGGEVQFENNGIPITIDIPNLDIKTSGFRVVGGLSVRIGG